MLNKNLNDKFLFRINQKYYNTIFYKSLKMREKDNIKHLRGQKGPKTLSVH